MSRVTSASHSQLSACGGCGEREREKRERERLREVDMNGGRPTVGGGRATVGCAPTGGCFLTRLCARKLRGLYLQHAASGRKAEAGGADGG
jgi:hypothetical protein